MSQLSRDLEQLSLPFSTAVSYPTASGERSAVGVVKKGSMFYVEVKPHAYLWITEPVCFEFRIPMSYGAVPPVVTCLTSAFILDHGPKVSLDEVSGQVGLPILRTGSMGWSRGYCLSDVIHCLHQCLRLTDMPMVRVLDSPAASDAIIHRPALPPVVSGEHGLQGKRPTMEDQTVCIDRLSAAGRTVALYAVYDGHGGVEASKFASQRLHGSFTDNCAKGQDMRHALWQAFQDTDSAFTATLVTPADTPVDGSAGTTAVVTVVDFPTLVVANVGDSRAVLSRAGSAVALTDDHKATRPEEVARIVNAGGMVAHNRVMGRLAVSRAIGDVDLSMVTAVPEIFETTLCDKDELLVLACDGLFDVMSNQQAVESARLHMSEGMAPADIAKALAEEALGLGSGDNISVVVVKIGGGVPRHSIKRPPQDSHHSAASGGGGGGGGGVGGGGGGGGAGSGSGAGSGGGSGSGGGGVGGGGGDSGATGSPAHRRSGSSRFSNNPFSRNFGAGHSRQGSDPSAGAGAGSGAASSGSSGGGGGGGDGKPAATPSAVGAMLSGMRLDDAPSPGPSGAASVPSYSHVSSLTPWTPAKPSSVVPSSVSTMMATDAPKPGAASGGDDELKDDADLMRFLLDDSNFD